MMAFINLLSDLQNTNEFNLRTPQISILTHGTLIFDNGINRKALAVMPLLTSRMAASL